MKDREKYNSKKMLLNYLLAKLFEINKEDLIEQLDNAEEPKIITQIPEVKPLKANYVGDDSRFKALKAKLAEKEVALDSPTEGSSNGKAE